MCGKSLWFSGKNMISLENFSRPENFCHFMEKMWYVRKFFWYVRKIFLSFSIEKCPSTPAAPPPPQLSDASYGAVYLRRGRDWKTVGNNWRLVLLFFSCPWLCLPTTIHSFYPWGETVLLGHLNIDVYTLQQTSNRQRSFWFSTTLL
jgi:hypothetical protein